MTFDIAIETDKDTYLDGANDLALISGPKRVEQSIAINIIDADERFIGNRVTARTVNRLEKAIKDALEADNDVDEVFDVTIDTFDRNDDRIEVEIFVAPGESFVAEVNL